MNNRERVFCSVIKVIYEKYKTYGVFEFNAILFTYSELEEAFNSLHFGKEFRKSLFTNYYYGHGSKNEKIKFIVDGFVEESMELYRLAYPGENELYKETLSISKMGWECLNEYDPKKVSDFLKKYSLWIKKHKAEKNSVPGLSTNEAAWVSAVLLTYNTYYHDTDRCELEDLFFSTSRITNLAFSLWGEYAKSTYSNAVRNRSVNHRGTNAYLSWCPDNTRRITFGRETKEYAPKLDDKIKLATVNGKKTIKAIKKSIGEICLYYYPTEEEYEVLKVSGLAKKAHVCVNGRFIRRARENVIEYVLKRYCYSHRKYDYFQERYFDTLEEAGLLNDSAFSLEPDYKFILFDRKDIICSGNDVFKRFFHSEKFIKRVIAKLDLDQYKNKEISASLLLKRGSEALKHTGLENADEVYDFIKKYVNKNEYKISLRASNEISFGESSVKNQLLDVISKYSPLEKKVLIFFYSREYGSDKAFIESQLPSISDHYDGRRYWSGIPKKGNEPISPGRLTRSILAQFQDGDKEIRRRPPDIKRIESVLSKLAPEDTEWGRLRNRIIREFFDTDLVCEIELSDEDYALLKEKHFNPRCRQIAVRNDVGNGTDILLTVGMVNVAIREYDGSLWPNVAEIIGMKKLTAAQQAKIGTVIYRTLMKYGKAYVDVNENLRNVLMHAFITDSFASDFFKYLFQFYNLDLDRNISDTCDEEANHICEAIKNPHSKRQQMLSEYSGLSIYAAYDYCKGMIAAALKAIDNAFWGASNDVSGLPTRLYEKLIEWKNTERGDFRKEKARGVGTYKKYFNTPLLTCKTYGDVSFAIVLPKQLIQSSDNDDRRQIKWRVRHGAHAKEYSCRLSEGNFGLKTDEITVDIESADIFDRYTFELFDDQMVIKTFTWEEKHLCVFDCNGYYENLTSLTEGEYIGFAPRGIKIESGAIEDSYDIPGMTYYQFVFSMGDILCVSEDANYYIGDIPQRGFSRDGLLDSVCVYDENGNKLQLYSKVPALIIDIENEKLDGTAIVLNGKKYRASELKPIDIKNGRLLDQNFYFFNLGDATSIRNGFNHVDIDIPGTNRGKGLEFIYIENFDFGFEDAPYIYKTRGTLRTNYHFEKKAISDTRAKDFEYFDFDFADLEDNVLKCPLKVAGVVYTISFEVPLLLYSSDQIEWSYYRPDDYWHSELPITIYLKYPSKTIKLELAEDNGDTISFKYDRRSDGTFECDLTKVKSYIGPFHTKKMLHTIHLQDGAEKYDLLRVINHSVFSNVELTADIDDNKILANFDVLGKGEYFADIRQSGDLVCEKAALDANNHLEIETKIKTGEYEVTLYEGESDEDSFDLDIQYQFVGKLVRKLRNPSDIVGERIILRALQYVVDSENIRSLPVSEKYINYISIDNKVDKHSYDGTLIVAFHGTDIRDVKKVKVIIPDFNRTNSMLVNFLDEYHEPDNLLYDSYSECVATPEYSNQCNKNERYRRYDPVLWTDEEESYYWNVEYVSRDAALERTAKEWIKTEHYKTSSDSIWKN